MNPSVFGDAAAQTLVVAHAVVAIVLAGATGHAGWLSVQRLRGRDVPSARMLRHLKVIGACLGAVLLAGLLAYPHYRVHVRGLVLDRDFPWASNLFDMKEHAAAVAAPLWVAAYGVESGPSSAKPAAWLSLALSALIYFTLLAGLIVTSVRGA
jgi:hypothetical protein